MKKVILTITFLLAFVPMLFAQRGLSTLRVSLSDNSHLMVALNGRRFDKHGTSLTIGDLPGGRHELKVYAYDAPDDRGLGKPHLVYRGYVRLHRGTFAECVIDPRTGDIQVNENGDEGDSRYSYSQRQRRYGNAQDDRRNDEQDERRYDENEAPRDDVYDNGDRNSDNSRDYRNEQDKNDTEPAVGSFGTGAMSKGDMDGLKSMVRGKSGDGEKVRTMETELKGKSFTIEQVGKMMSWVDADDSRLELAEWAYPQTTDKENYKKLGSAFKSGSYLKELDMFVESRK